MKIAKSDYAVMREKMFDVLQELPTAAYEYNENKHRWFRWDVLWATGLKIGDGVGMPGDLNLYAYANDDHIDTALKRIMREWLQEETQPRTDAPALHSTK